ncbi:hypothetical protein ACF08M_38170 [Streptomyces sp. NPDC015032]|uniref:hypothetical protein n=1 Tax=Streptomyces sp. NPDC015032 TaxID=3364937 RepID=UPI003701E4E8
MSVRKGGRRHRPAAGRPGRPGTLLGDKGYDSNPNRDKRLAVRWERRTELYDAFITLACSLICWRRLKKARS